MDYEHASVIEIRREACLDRSRFSSVLCHGLSILGRRVPSLRQPSYGVLSSSPRLIRCGDTLDLVASQCLAPARRPRGATSVVGHTQLAMYIPWAVPSTPTNREIRQPIKQQDIY